VSANHHLRCSPLFACIPNFCGQAVHPRGAGLPTKCGSTRVIGLPFLGCGKILFTPFKLAAHKGKQRVDSKSDWLALEAPVLKDVIYIAHSTVVKYVVPPSESLL